MAPFDTFYLTALAFVIERATNRSVSIIAFAAGETPNGFSVSSVEMQTKSEYTYDPGTGPITVEVDSSLVTISGKRTQFAQAFTMCLLVINWALTIGSTYITLLVVVRRDEKMNDAVLLLPVTIVLTIPTLRNLYVGLPTFGIYIGRPCSHILIQELTPLSDTFGFFLQMMTVALCSMILLYVIGLRRIDKSPVI